MPVKALRPALGVFLMQLQDFENSCLGPLQQSAMINFGGAPLWTAGITGNQQPQFPQSMIDFQINRGYIDLMREFADVMVGFFSTQITSQAGTLQYAIPPTAQSLVGLWNIGVWNINVWAPAPVTPNPPCQKLVQVYYAPQGLQYNLEFEPGIRMLPWKEFQRYTSAGYLEAYSFGPQPEICSLDPSRKFLWFYPGTANTGDIITLNYIPIPTAGTQVPLLVNETDEPLILPDDVQELIPYYALWKLLPRARDAAGAAFYKQFYTEECNRIKDQYIQSTGANRMRFTDAAEDRASSGPYAWTL